MSTFSETKSASESIQLPVNSHEKTCTFDKYQITVLLDEFGVFMGIKSVSLTPQFISDRILLSANSFNVDRFYKEED